MPRLVIVALMLAAAPLHADDPTSDQTMLRRAFDGAMTCSAIAAIRADQVETAKRWRWDNRSFAFGMLAARFWGDATQKAMSRDELDEALNRYAQTLVEMLPEQREPFETGCAAKYPDVDELCEANPCPFAGPPAAEPPAAQ